jgi:hypothetical protein
VEAAVSAITGDWTDEDWLVLIEDEGPRGLGRVLGFLVFDTQFAAQRVGKGAACEACNLFKGEEIPDDVNLEVLRYDDFKTGYGNRMPLCNRGVW